MVKEIWRSLARRVYRQASAVGGAATKSHGRERETNEHGRASAPLTEPPSKAATAGAPEEPARTPPKQRRWPLAKGKVRLDGYVDVCALVSGEHVVLVGWIFNPDAPVEVVLQKNGAAITDAPTLLRGRRPDVSDRLDDASAPWGFVALAKATGRIDVTDAVDVILSCDGVRRELQTVARRRSLDDVLQALGQFTADERLAVVVALRNAGLDVIPTEEAGCELWELEPMVDGRIDLAIPVPGEGLFVAGWLFDSQDSIASLYVRCDGLMSPNILGKVARFERKDVTDLFAAHRAPTVPAGFLGFVPMPQVEKRSRFQLVVITKKGVRANVPIGTDVHQNDQRALRDVLSSLEPHKDGALARLEHVSAAASALRTAPRRGTPEPSVMDFGDPPPSVRYSIVVPLGRQQRAFLQQLSHFSHDPEIALAEILYVVQEPALEEEICGQIAEYQPNFGVFVRVVCPARRVSLAVATSLGVQRAKGLFVALLGCDVVPKEPGWLGRLSTSLESLPEAGVVGARVLNPDETVAHDGVEFERSEDLPTVVWPLVLGTAEPKASAQESPTSVVAALPGDCMVLERDLFDRLGGLDDGYVREAYSHVDLCFNAMARGLRNYVVRTEEVRRVRATTKDATLSVENDGLDEARAFASAWRLTRRWPVILTEIAGELGDAPAQKKRGRGRDARKKRKERRKLAAPTALADVRGNIDVLTSRYIEGWVRDAQSIESAPVVLDLYVNGEWAAEVVGDRPHASARVKCGFRADIPPRAAGLPTFVVELRARGTTEPVLGTPMHYHDSRIGIGLLQELGRALRSGKMALPGVDGELTARDAIPELIALLREQDVVDHRAGIRPQVGAASGTTVIVPVYDGYDETMRCLDALVSSRADNETPFDILVIDDCGPSPALRTRLQTMEREGVFRVIVNEKNLGFVKSVNRGLRLSVGRDVVLLNADAVVHAHWLDRLRAAAYSEPSVATVTPLSNDATICSYPSAPDGGEMPDDSSLEELDQTCERQNRGLYVPIPTGVGFCMYMRAAALGEVGLLDEDRFGRGYGEENDWCMRALDRGFQHLCACDVFVEHLGGVSFGKSEKSGLVQKNLGTLCDLYPEYTQVVEAFIKRDPIRPARNNIARARLFERLRPYAQRILYVSHGLGGGIEAHCRDMALRLHEENVAVLTLEPAGDADMTLRYEDIALVYERAETLDALATDLEALGVKLVHLHSDIGFADDLWELPRKLRVPFDVTLHDYLAVCPRVNFTDQDGRYCREPSDPGECQKCVATNSTYPGLQSRLIQLGGAVVSWRAVYGDRLFRARRVFAPNEDVAERFGKYFPDLAIDVKPHPMDAVSVTLGPPILSGTLHKVAVIGAIGPHKGYEALLGCARDALDRKLPLQFIVVGFSSDDEELAELPNLVITGAYDEETLPGLLTGERYSAALFLSEWPETYSYTLAEALRAGIPPVAMNIGAPAKRLRKLGVGRLIELGASPAAINDALLETAQDRQQRRLELSEGRYERLVTEYYGFRN